MRDNRTLSKRVAFKMMINKVTTTDKETRDKENTKKKEQRK